MKKIFGLLLALAIVQISEAQNTRYIIKFKNKGTNPFSISNPSAYLSQRSINRRTSYSISIDSTDLPITPRYIDSVRLAGAVTILNPSKWLNSVSIQTTDAAALAKINSFPFVQSVTSIAPRPMIEAPSNNKFSIENNPSPISLQKELDITADFFNYGLSYDQVHIHNGEFLHNIGLRGQTMIIGVVDAGFQNYLTVKAFDSARANGQILGIYDFVAKDSSVNEDNSHGMQCLSTIAANIPGQFIGTAPKASFYLFRTEDAATEFPIEEHNWVCGAERVDSAGGNLISSSLGYNVFDAPFAAASHTYADMNGNTTIVAIGADLAAKKGILVVNSAGNEGANPWKYIITPADGDSVLAVGAVNTAGIVAGFSSYGPSSDGQVKPDVASHGVNTTVQLPGNTIGINSGTSFAAPNIAGLTTCLWQGFPEYNNIKIIDALRRSGNIASAPNDRIGYGIPDVKKATFILLKDFATSTASITNCNTTINFTSKDMSLMKYEIERKNPGASNYLKVAEVAGTGGSFISHNYQLIDPIGGLQAGVVSYRIRQIIDTVSASFSADYIDTVNVNLAANCGLITGVDPVNANTEVSLSPNPATNNFYLKITTPTVIQRLVISITNSKGQTVAVLNKSKSIGTVTINVPVAKLARGKYYVSIYNDQKLLATKELIKL